MKKSETDKENKGKMPDQNDEVIEGWKRGSIYKSIDGSTFEIVDANGTSKIVRAAKVAEVRIENYKGVFITENNSLSHHIFSINGNSLCDDGLLKCEHGDLVKNVSIARERIGY